MQIPLGRVVGSKIRNGNEMPTNFTGWLDGDIFILNKENIPYYEYDFFNKKLKLLGELKGSNGSMSVLTIGENGNWYIDGVDTENKAQGPIGETGPQGPQGPQGVQGEQGISGKDGNIKLLWYKNETGYMITSGSTETLSTTYDVEYGFLDSIVFLTSKGIFELLVDENHQINDRDTATLNHFYYNGEKVATVTIYTVPNQNITIKSDSSTILIYGIFINKEYNNLIK